MTITLGFDVYGTLIDTAGVTQALRPLAGDRAPAFAQLWRDKQLEYSFRRALMRRYADFSVCIAQAFDYTARVHGLDVPSADRERLLGLYRALPAFPDVVPGLAALSGLPLRLMAFSNGRRDDVDALLSHAGIRDRFERVVSLLDIRTFKPDPAAYEHFRQAAGGGEAWLVSSNPFDVIGALAAGLKAAWVRRAASAVFDPWDVAPTATIGSLGELAGLFRGSTATA
ncbi:MAG TPA: haloacid dehalogenase type II [Burkholderiales bacterium]|jgi:2-haloacid dehalogenase|nr:haloacid dehalogenase type II [Burkholderiales bacterium]